MKDHHACFYLGNCFCPWNNLISSLNSPYRYQTFNYANCKHSLSLWIRTGYKTQSEVGFGYLQ